jgi:hypothetical protein
MKKITSVVELKEAISLLEIKRDKEEQLLKEQLKTTYENLKPINLIKNKFNELISAPDLKANVLKSVLSVAAGYLTNKVAVGSTHNPLKKLLGVLLQMGVTSLVASNADEIKKTATDLINTFFNEKNEDTVNPKTSTEF